MQASRPSPDAHDAHDVESDRSSRPENSRREAERALEQGDNEKIDKTLEDLNVSTTDSGRDQTQDEDTEGSNSSSKNLDKQKQ